VVDKTKQRLESLEDDEEGSVQTMLDMTQQEYVKHIDELQQQLIAAWDSDQRVKALKIAIQVRRCRFIGLDLFVAMLTVCAFPTSHPDLSPERQAAGGHQGAPVLPVQVCAHHRDSGHLWSPGLRPHPGEGDLHQAGYQRGRPTARCVRRTCILTAQQRISC